MTIILSGLAQPSTPVYIGWTEGSSNVGDQVKLRILETAIYAADLDAARSFYNGVLGLPVETEVAGRHVFFRMPESMLLVFAPEKSALPTTNPRLPVPAHGAQGPGHVCFAAAAADLDAWIVRFRAEGIEIEADFLWPNGARSVYVRDPAGNSVEFSTPALWGFS